ncbi:MAG: DUF554 domain-containing protein [Firmicutes bacterium]|jgi:uncharacterized membrane protein YqgA involved in biofilm formation|nr:DUF554 domain-containing protein [Bacillota bacterium]
MVGTIINVVSVVAGSCIGLAFGHRLPSRISETVMQAMGLFTFFIGLRMAWGTADPFMLLLSLVAGTTLGSALDIEGRLDRLGERIRQRVGAADGGSFTQGFVAASLLYCVGPMAIMGSLQDGLSGDFTVLATKSVMDGTASVALSSGLGAGVAFSALPLLAYQGSISLMAGALRPLMTEAVVREMTAAGGILMLGIGLNLILRTRVRVANMIPALFGAALAAGLFMKG